MGNDIVMATCWCSSVFLQVLPLYISPQSPIRMAWHSCPLTLPTPLFHQHCSSDGCRKSNNWRTVDWHLLCWKAARIGMGWLQSLEVLLKLWSESSQGVVAITHFTKLYLKHKSVNSGNHSPLGGHLCPWSRCDFEANEVLRGQGGLKGHRAAMIHQTKRAM